MAHETKIPFLNRDNITEYFESLSKEIEIAGIGMHSILVVGGAAIALKHREQRSTVDIDMCFREQNNLYRCCQKVALKYNLPDDWINADVMHSDSFSYELFRNAELYKEYGNNLRVFIVSDLDLYCMKLVSFRPKDVQDMVLLKEDLILKGVTVQNVRDNFVRLYGSEFFLKNDSRKEKFVKAQLDKQ